MQQLKDKLNKTADKIANFLAATQNQNGTFPSRTFYGEAYAAALWSKYDVFAPYIGCVFNRYLNAFPLLKEDADTHWEFINYGLLVSRGFRFEFDHNNERVVNWQLLKVLTYLMNGGDVRNPMVRNVCNAISKIQYFDGLIPDFFTADSRNTPSHQYHNFSVCLCGELVLRGVSGYDTLFGRGINYIQKIAKPNGDVNYVGRGKGQLKGYAVAIHALVQHDHLVLADRILDYVLRFEMEDQPLPLYLSGHEPSYTQVGTAPEGWEAYNNYFDYLALAGYYFKCAAGLLK